MVLLHADVVAYGSSCAMHRNTPYITPMRYDLSTLADDRAGK
jgi:hypothetical protein